MSKGSNKDRDRILRRGQLPPHMKEILKQKGVLSGTRGQEERAQETPEQRILVNTQLIDKLFTVSRQTIFLVKELNEEVEEIKKFLSNPLGQQTEPEEGEIDDKQE